MTNTVHRFMAVAASDAAVAKELCKTLSPIFGDGMFVYGYSTTGIAPATHYISSGLIDSQFAGILGNAAATFGAYQAAKGTDPLLVTLAQVQLLYANAIIRSDAQGVETTVLDLIKLKPVG